ncbi:MAG: hypothetical protein Q8O34_08455, partial [Rhodocyclaceae bacterium]|nr:hypothetical protein [Rhodocyclaceae bacterium]
RLKSNDFGKLPNCTADATHCPENDSGLTSSITYTDERDGDHNYLVDESTGAVTAPKGGFDSLQLDTASGQHTLTFRNGVKYRFEVPSGNLKTTPDVVARLKYIDNAWGDRLTLAYDANGRLSTVADNLGVSGRTGLVFTYDANGRLKDVSDWSARKWSYGFDAAGNLIHKTNPLNEVLTYTYWPDARHLLNEIVQPLARDGLPVKTAFKYYQNGRAFSQTDSFGLGDTLDYDLYRKRTRVTNSRGGVREYAYDANGGLIQLTEPDGGILLFDNQGDAIRSKKYDALGYATTYSYRADKAFTGASDNFGNVSRERDALGNNIDTTYGALDQIASVKDKRGTVSTTTYAASTTATAQTCGD